MRNTNQLDSASAPKGDDAARERLLKLLLAAERKRAEGTVLPRGHWQGPLPLSYAQERLWFLDQVGLVGTAYNVPLALRLVGDLSEPALERSFNELIRRHESLRTRFGARDGVPYQLIDPPRSLDLCRVDFEEVHGTELRLRELMSRERVHRFDLREGPLFRVTLVKLSAREHALLLTMHHIVMDGWSSGVLIHELSALYAAFARSEPSPLPLLEVQYADYAIWQRQWLQGRVLEEQLKYWRERLAGAPPQLELPTDRPRPAVESFRGAVLKFDLPQELSAALKELGRREGATLFMVLLAAYQVLLSRWSGQQDIVVGAPIAGRKNREIEGLIGFFVNTLVLRTQVCGELRFRELLGRVKELTLGAYEHQDLPFDVLVKELRPERNLTRQPIFQVVLTLQNFPEEHLQLPGLTWTWTGAESATTHFDLTLYLYERGDRLSGAFEYASDLFDAQTIERMAAQLSTLLKAIVADPDCAVHDLPLLSEQERQQLLVEWNQTAATYPHGQCVHELFSEQAQRTPRAAALVQEERQLSYAELEERSNQLAHRLRELEVGPEAVVGLYMERSLELVIAMLGILKAGGAYLPLDPGYPKERLELMLRDAGAQLLLTKSGVTNQLVHAGHTLYLDAEWDAITSRPSTPVHAAVTAQNLAYVIYTSGSTGTPKGVMVEHRGLVNYLEWARRLYAPHSGEAVLVSSPLAFDATGTGLYGALLSGRPAVLLQDGQELDELERRLLQADGRWSLIKVSPAHLQVLGPRLQAHQPPRTVDTIVVGGEALPASVVKLWRSMWPQVRIMNQYGPTETVVACSVYELPADWAAEGSVPIGRPGSNVRAYVLDARMQPTPIGVSGELYIGGLQVSRGYRKRPEMTAQRFLADPFGAPGSRMYRTGDLVRRLPEGTLQFIGRTDNQVKIRGYRIELGEIEAQLARHEQVREAVVLAREEDDGEKRLVAYVVGDRSVASPSESATSASMRNDSVSEWQAVHDGTYRTSTASGPSFVGWNSSYTGEPLPESEMREWLTGTVERIRALRPQRVLEIGCGVGLLLQHLAPECETYVGTDLSAAAIEQLGAWIRGRPELQHVQLLRRSASELEGLPAAGFDTVVLNSVVQYFPDSEYLVAVLQRLMPLLAPSAKIFLGDVRHLGLLPAFHSSVQLGKAGAKVSVGQLRRRIERSLTQEKELLIDPRFFHAIALQMPRITSVEVQLKRGRAANELTRYRYDVVLRIEEQSDATTIDAPLRWNVDVESMTELQDGFRTRRWRVAQLSGIPDARLAREAATQTLIGTSDEQLEVSALRRQLNDLRFRSVDPQVLWELGEAHGYEVTIYPGEPGCMDALLCDRARVPHESRVTMLGVVEAKQLSAYVNDPLENAFRQQLIPRLREYLKERLPDYMIPSAWMVLKTLPLTSNGKVDRRALPNPQGRPEELGEYVAPRTEVERALADIWAQLLQVDQVGVHDNFFELGGHSLHSVKLITRVAELFALRLSAIAVFQYPTIEQMARLVGTLHCATRPADPAAEAEFEAGTV